MTTVRRKDEIAEKVIDAREEHANNGIAMLLVMWCFPAPESDIAVTIIFVVAIVTDKPLLIIWLVSRAYMKCCKRDTVAQLIQGPMNGKCFLLIGGYRVFFYMLELVRKFYVDP
ncbi:hypothetical protein NECAME_15594 [Necator americanus]|uniref:Uncharacterized protein n=1 Tax=Necator americanus TaxID=51031 RepID=W2SH18_NECAM|nr:hypothetical protein NECAME_15594 [Necator americanus]ETN68823.1 hypothetical protein NECAME_15594 [Necator americanus]